MARQTSVGFGAMFADPELESDIRTSLDAVEVLLAESVRADDEFLHEVARHLMLAGGKRFRPLVTVLAAQFGDPTAWGVIESAVVMELTHLATLYHDDVMDEATVRRGAEAANARWTNTVAILTGDFLFARASNLLADLGPEAVRIQARTYERLVTGQIRETVGPVEGADVITHYLDVLANKTGSLIAASAQLGGMFAGLDEPTIAALCRYAEQVGVAFQISDDILDIASDSDESGKTPGTDLREGVHTLPVLYALRSNDPASARLRELVARPITDDAEHAEALELLRNSTALAEARATLAECATQAYAALADLPDVPAKAAFEALSQYVVARTG
jgi:heptaprenyl diphosphate synthase